MSPAARSPQITAQIATRTFHLGQWRVEPAARRLRRGEIERRLSPKAMAVLARLAATPGRVVSRGELMDAVWPDVAVGEEILTHAIAELRRRLDDDSRAPRYIETVHKSGYRLLVEVADRNGQWDARGDGRAAKTAGHDDSQPEARHDDPAVTLDAYLLCLQANALFYRGGKPNLREALALFSQAIDLDPALPSAHAGLTACLAFLYLYYEPDETHLTQALEVGEAAPGLAPGAHAGLDARFAAVHAALGLARAASGNFAAAGRSFGTAFRLAPDSFEPHYLFGRACFAAGDFRTAAALFEQAAQIRQADFHAPYLAAKARRAQGDEPGARHAYARALARANAHLMACPDDLLALCDKACCLVELGQVDQSLQLAEPLLTSEDPLAFYLACALARAGEVSPALDCLDRVIGNGWSHAAWLAADPDLNPLRGEPRFRRLESTLGLQ